MATKYQILLFFIALCTWGSIAAQTPDSLATKGKWTGNVSAEGGTNFKFNPKSGRTHHAGAIDASLGYDSRKFKFDFATSLDAEYKVHGKLGLNVRSFDNDTSANADNSIKTTKELDSKTSFNFLWKGDKLNTYKAYYKITIEADEDENITTSSKWTEHKVYDYSVSYEDGNETEYVHKAGFRYDHIIPSVEGIFSIDASGELSYDRNYSEWLTGSRSENQYRYRLTPNSNYHDAKIILTYTDKNVFGAKDLDAIFSFGYNYRKLNDHLRGATYKNGAWKDSLAAREDFHYRTVTVVPRVGLKYKVGTLKLSLSAAPEYFAYKIDGNGKTGNIDRGRLMALFDVDGSYDISEGHNISFNMDRSDDRPEYYQLCWFPRISKIFPDEIYMGNPDLQSSIVNSAEVSYKYSYKGFSTSVKLSDEYQHRKIFQTFSNDTINGKEYRVYYWINGGKSNEFTTELKAGWKNDSFAASLAGDCTYYVGYSASGSRTQSFNYSVKANIKYSVNTWAFELGTKYDSEVSRSYYTLSNMIDNNFKISKSFLDKRLVVYILGLNILDKPIVYKTISEDLTEARIERRNDLNGIFKLGLTFKF